LRRTLGEQIDLQIRVGNDVWPALVDANQLENAILNLAINARDAMPNGGALTIETENFSSDQVASLAADELETGEYTLVSVTDTGVGMSRETAAKAFDPFFTTKPIGQGTGLGLSMIYGFAKQSRGLVRIESEVGKGTKVLLYLPRYQGLLVRPDESASRKAPHGFGEAVLLVEDDPSVRLLITEVLQDLNYRCVVADDSADASTILASDIRLDLMITDIGLPGMNGRQLAEVGWQHRPALKVLFVTGYADRANLRDDLPGGRFDVMTKPFALAALAIRIQEMIGT
jgi:CheY-like chemotaxis protein